MTRPLGWLLCATLWAATPVSASADTIGDARRVLALETSQALLRPACVRIAASLRNAMVRTSVDDASVAVLREFVRSGRNVDEQSGVCAIRETSFTSSPTVRIAALTNLSWPMRWKRSSLPVEPIYNFSPLLRATRRLPMNGAMRATNYARSRKPSGVPETVDSAGSLRRQLELRIAELPEQETELICGKRDALRLRSADEAVTAVVIDAQEHGPAARRRTR